MSSDLVQRSALALAGVLAAGCAALEHVPSPELPPSARAPAHFARPLYQSRGPAPAAYRVLEPGPGCSPREVRELLPVVFIHGLGDLGYSLASLARASTPCATKIIVDLPGLGESPARERDITTRSVLAALEDVIEREARGGRVIVVGHSLGGTLALRLAARRPRRVAGALVMSAPVEPFSLGDDQRFVLDHWRTLLPAMRLVGPYALMRDVYAAQAAKRVEPGAVYRALLTRQASSHERFAAAEALTRTVLSRAEMARMQRERARIAARLLFVYGTEDSWTPPPESDFVRSAGTATLELAGVGHLAHVEAPAEVTQAARSFIVDVSRTEPARVPPPMPDRLRARPNITEGDEIYGPGSELHPVVGAFVLSSRGESDIGPLIAIARGSVDRDYPVEAGRVTALLGIATPASGGARDRSYARLAGRAELVWRWVGGLSLEGSALAGEAGGGGFGALGYVPSLLPWVRAYAGYGVLPELRPGWVLGAEANFALTRWIY